MKPSSLEEIKAEINKQFPAHVKGLLTRAADALEEWDTSVLTADERARHLDLIAELREAAPKRDICTCRGGNLDPNCPRHKELSPEEKEWLD